MSESRIPPETQERIESIQASVLQGLMPSVALAVGPYPSDPQARMEWVKSADSLVNQLLPVAIQSVREAVEDDSELEVWLASFEDDSDKEKKVYAAQVVDAWELTNQGRGIVILQNEFIKHPEGKLSLAEAQKAARQAVGSDDKTTWMMKSRDNPVDGDLNQRGLVKLRTDHLNEETGLRAFNQALQHIGKTCKIYQHKKPWQDKAGIPGFTNILMYVQPLLSGQQTADLARIENFANQGVDDFDDSGMHHDQAPNEPVAQVTAEEPVAEPIAEPEIERQEVSVMEVRGLMASLNLGKQQYPGILESVGIPHKPSKELNSEELRKIYNYLEQQAVAVAV